jgi:hypothetical protein
MMMIVMPAFAQRQDGNPNIVAAGIRPYFLRRIFLLHFAGTPL